MGQATQTQSIEQTLNKTDLGHLVYEYRKVFFGIIIAVLVGATGWALWNESQKSSALDNSVKVFEFQSQIWEEAKAGKITPTQLVEAWKKLASEVKTAPVMVPLVLEMGTFLYGKEALNEAESIISDLEGTQKHPIPMFFLSMQRAVVLEKLGKVDEAIATLENLSKSKEAIMPAKISVSLGRLYLTKGEKGKAQTQFENVMSTYPNDEQAKLAKLYLSQLSR